MPMYNDLVCWKNDTENECCDSARRVAQQAQNFKPRLWPFLGPGDEEKWYGGLINKPDGERNLTAMKMMQEFLISIVERRVLKRERGNDSVHCNEERKSAEMLMKTIVSANPCLQCFP